MPLLHWCAMSDVQLSVVILSWNSKDVLSRCLKSLQTHLLNIAFEVWVVDNGSMDGTDKLLLEYQQSGFPLHTIMLPSNVGTTVSRNQALKKCRGQYICVLDSDLELVQDDMMHGLMHYLEEHPMCGLVAPRLLFPSGHYQKSIDTFPTLSRKLQRAFFLRGMEKKEGELLKMYSPREVDYAISAFWLMRREILETVGLLDENIFYAPEDLDYCLRIWLSGYQIMYTPEWFAVHHAQEISRRNWLSFSTREHLRGLVYYYKKYGSWFGTKSLYLSIQLAVQARKNH